MENLKGRESKIEHFHVMLGENTDSTLSVSESSTIKCHKFSNESIQKG